MCHSREGGNPVLCIGRSAGGARVLDSRFRGNDRLEDFGNPTTLTPPSPQREREKNFGCHSRESGNPVLCIGRNAGGERVLDSRFRGNDRPMDCGRDTTLTPPSPQGEREKNFWVSFPRKR